MSKYFKILIIGPQGCGKGTQAQILSDRFKIPILSTGNILRQRLQQQNEMAAKLANMMNSGILPPDEIVNPIIIDRIKKDGQAGYILDGYPRNLTQARFFDAKHQLTHVFELRISDQESMRRFLGRRTCEQCQTVYHLKFNPPKQAGICDKCGGKLIIRDDETRDILKKRLTIYHEQTEPIINFYRVKNILHTINGEQPIPDVTKDILSEL